MVIGSLCLWLVCVNGLGPCELIKGHVKNMWSLGPCDFGGCLCSGWGIVNPSNDFSKTYGHWGLVTLADVCEGVVSL